jgi:hypothetical protein
MASAVLFERHPFDRMVLCRTVAKVLSMGFVVRKCSQLLGGTIVEGEQRFAILLQAFSGLLVFDRVGLDEGVERGLGLGRHPDRLQGPLGLGVLALWQLVQHVCRLEHPAALLARFRPHLAERLPEPESAIGGGEFRHDRQATPLQIEQQGAPVVSALARAVVKPTSSFLPSGVAPMMTRMRATGAEKVFVPVESP